MPGARAKLAVAAAHDVSAIVPFAFAPALSWFASQSVATAEASESFAQALPAVSPGLESPRRCQCAGGVMLMAVAKVGAGR